MKRFLRNQKAISLISLSITVIVLVIITNIIIYNLQDNLGLERLRNMQNDIENLRGKVDSYYAQYGAIPKIDKEYNINADEIDVIGENDTGKFYVIDLSSLENLTLTYGEDYRKIKAEPDVNNLEDIYIINEASHNIFYVKGINLNDETYYTDYTTDDVDSEKIEIRYFDGVKIIDGYTYVSGNTASDLVIQKENDTLQYKWLPVNEKITTLPETIGNIGEADVEEFLDSVNRYKGYYISTSDSSEAVYIGQIENWSPTYDMESKYTDKNGDSAYIPYGFQVSRVPGSDTIDKGLVARNATTDNRYVWIEIPKSIFKTVTASDDYINIEKDMQDYAKDYTSNYFYDTWDSNNCAIANEEDYKALKNEMLKSVYENGGFWISQYEIGTDEVRSAASTIPDKSYSKEGMYPLNYITCTDAQTISSTMEKDIGERQTSLLFGIQWKLILKTIEDRGEKTQSELKADSTNWANYAEADFYIAKGKFSINNGQEYTEISSSYNKPESNSVLLTTGTTTRNSVLNIYDLAGNVGEWTLERGYNSHGVYGGSYNMTVNAYYRENGASNLATGEQSKSHYIGFRVALY